MASTSTPSFTPTILQERDFFAPPPGLRTYGGSWNSQRQVILQMNTVLAQLLSLVDKTECCDDCNSFVNELWSWRDRMVCDICHYDLESFESECRFSYYSGW